MGRITRTSYIRVYRKVVKGQKTEKTTNKFFSGPYIKTLQIVCRNWQVGERNQEDYKWSNMNTDRKKGMKERQREKCTNV